MTEQSARVQSPCVHICALDDNDVCIGCQRTVQEITAWGRMDDLQRREVLHQCQLRAEAAGLLLSKGR